MNPPDVTVFHLEMCDRSAFRPVVCRQGFEVAAVVPPDANFNRVSYHTVGAQWKWIDRAGWTNDDWKNYVDSDTITTYVGKLNGVDIGYFELQSQVGGDIEITYFGLFLEYIGRGLGGVFLTAAIKCAWELPGACRVWVHTCTRDHPNALGNYRARGFTLFKTV